MRKKEDFHQQEIFNSKAEYDYPANFLNKVTPFSSNDSIKIDLLWNFGNRMGILSPAVIPITFNKPVKNSHANFTYLPFNFKIKYDYEV